MFGAPVQRREDPRLVTGNGRYLDDLGRGALAAAFVRSPFAHARIMDIDVKDRRTPSAADPPPQPDQPDDGLLPGS
jgi:CO/xanthine dehydrogenase Mo-binding subunit